MQHKKKNDHLFQKITISLISLFFTRKQQKPNQRHMTCRMTVFVSLTHKKVVLNFGSVCHKGTGRQVGNVRFLGFCCTYRERVTPWSAGAGETRIFSPCWRSPFPSSAATGGPSGHWRLPRTAGRRWRRGGSRRPCSRSSPSLRRTSSSPDAWSARLSCCLYSGCLQFIYSSLWRHAHQAI